jgi:hypothetical protein
VRRTCRPVRAADREGGDSPELRELIGDHDARVAEAELDLHEPAIGDGDAATGLGAERAFVPLGCAGGAVDDDVRCHVCHVKLLA